VNDVVESAEAESDVRGPRSAIVMPPIRGVHSSTSQLNLSRFGQSAVLFVSSL
jgi:hypothetical protein